MAEGGSMLVAICQYGGEFTSGPNGNLVYKGGEAHAVDVTRDMSLENFKDEVSKVFHVDISDMSFKYFLPNNHKTLITISCDRDLQRMVDFTISAMQVEIFLISRAENRSVITHSGTSTVATSSMARGDKRKRLTSKSKVSKNNTRTPKSTGNMTQGYADNLKQKGPVITENVENRGFQLDLGSDVAFAAANGAASSTPEILKQQQLAVVD